MKIYNFNSEDKMTMIATKLALVIFLLGNPVYAASTHYGLCEGNRICTNYENVTTCTTKPNGQTVCVTKKECTESVLCCFSGDLCYGNNCGEVCGLN